MIPANFIGAHTPIDHGDIVTLAAKLQCTTAIVHSFSDLESSGSGFLQTGEPKILLEARYFHLLTGGQFDRVAPGISSPVWDRSLYKGGIGEYARLRQAMRLNRDAALKSCSIGRFQIMGANYKRAGYASIDAMWEAFCDNEENHLFGFGEFIRTGGLQDDMQADPPHFITLAVGYNGSGEAANGYHQKLETAYWHYADIGENVIPTPSGEIGRADDPHAPPLLPASIHVGDRELRAGMTGLDVQIMQRALGFHPPHDDGIFGRNETLPAVIAFQRSHGLRPIDGIAGHDTLTALGLI